MLTFQGKKIDLELAVGNYDIDKLMYISGALVEEWHKIVKKSKNGISLVELLSIAWSLRDEATFTIDNLQELRNEILDLDKQEMSQLASFIMGAFGLNTLEAYDVINNIVIASISIAVDIHSIVQNVKKLPRK